MSRDVSTYYDEMTVRQIRLDVQMMEEERLREQRTLLNITNRVPTEPEETRKKREEAKEKLIQLNQAHQLKAENAKRSLEFPHLL